MRFDATSPHAVFTVRLVGYISFLLLLPACSVACSHRTTRPEAPLAPHPAGAIAGTPPQPVRPPGSRSERPPADLPPEPVHEFRGIFVATAFNLDWPSKPGLPKSTLTREIRTVVSRARELHCNVILLQVRAFGDRMHRSSRLPRPELWSAALNRGGDRDPDRENPTAGYDPLGDWITQCHAAGIELHAWVNPFRVDRIVPDANGKPLPLLPSDDYNTLYLDYTQTSVQDYVIGVIDDLIKYRPGRAANLMEPGGGMLMAMRGTEGIDGLLFDHNLPEGHRPGGTSQPSTLRSAAARLTRHQRDIQSLASQSRQRLGPKSIDDFIQRVFKKVYIENGLKFGISPAHNDDRSIAWLRNRQVNYVIPELYFKGPQGTIQKSLGKWLNSVKRGSDFTPIVVAGLSTVGVQSPTAGSHQPWSGKEIADQIAETRRVVNPRGPVAAGQAHYAWRALRSAAEGGPRSTLGDLLKNDLYHQPALVPSCTAAAGSKLSDKPVVSLTNGTATWQLAADSKTRVRFWAVWLHESGPRSSGWGPMQVLGGTVSSRTVPPSVDRVAVKAIDHHNRESDFGVAGH